MTLTYQQAKDQLAYCEANGLTEQARDLEIWIDHELEKAYEYQAAVLDEMNSGGRR